MIALAAGAAAWITIGKYWTDGGGEIAAIFTSVFILMTGLFWKHHEKPWFWLLSFGWISLHLVLLFAYIIPMGLHRSKGFLIITWIDGLGLYALFSLANRIWDAPRTATPPDT